MNPRFTRLGGVAMLLVLTAASAYAQIPTRNLIVKGNFNQYPQPAGSYAYSSCWGYVHGDGREYAVIGSTTGTAIYNVTNPDAITFVASIPGLPSVWREMKSYRNWIYVVTEATTGNASIAPGIQIIRMTDPENPVLAGTYAVNFNHSHSVSVDTSRALLICNGTRMNTVQTGMRVLSLANPEAPVEVGWWPGGMLPVSTANYIHDCVPVGNRIYASSVYVGTQRIFDFTNPAAPTQIASFTYPRGFYSHNSWPDSSGNYLYVTDEQNGQTLRTIDISNPLSPVVVNEWTPNPQSIVHNAHVRGQDLWLASYTEGVRVMDISDPAHPAEYGWADTYPGPSGGFSGVWGIYPYFPSGTVIASDIETGLWVFRPQRSYGLVKVEVHGPVLAGALSAGPGHTTLHGDVAGAKVYTTQGDSTTLTADGIAHFAPPPGSTTIRVRKFGYEEASTTLNVALGSRQTVVLNLVPKSLTTYTGIIRDASNMAPLAQAEVTLSWTPVHAHTGPDGSFNMTGVPSDAYRVEVRRPGYMPRLAQRMLGPGPANEDFTLLPAAVYDPLATNQGWTVGGLGTGDNADTGVWTRVEPFGTYIGTPGPDSVSTTDMRADPRTLAAFDPTQIKPRAGLLHEGHEGAGNAGQVQPNTDRSPGPDSLCFVTGQGANATLVDQADVDGINGTPGKTTLTSPIYDVTGMANPVISFWTWFYSEFGSPDDWLAILISDDAGNSWAAVDTLRGLRNHWTETSVRVADHVTPTNLVRIRFVAADWGVGSVVEAAIDDISVYDGALAPVDAPPVRIPARLAFRSPQPNPSAGRTTFALDVPRAGHVDADVLDVSGRIVRRVYGGEAGAGMLRFAWDGRDASGRLTPAGVYFARARLGADQATIRLLIVR